MMISCDDIVRTGLQNKYSAVCYRFSISCLLIIPDLLEMLRMSCHQMNGLNYCLRKNDLDCCPRKNDSNHCFLKYGLTRKNCSWTDCNHGMVIHSLENYCPIGYHCHEIVQ